ncbi:hypothetical protein OBBRIDRAFT_734008, partial [Obba rivulosa]
HTGLQFMSSCAGILYFDYFLTLPEEIERFWTRSGNTFFWTSLLFVMNRYLPLLGSIPIIFEFFAVMPEHVRFCRCRSLQLYHQYLAAATQTIVAVLLLVRVNAMYNKNTRILLMLVVTICASLATAAWSILSGDELPRATEDPSIVSYGCDLSVSVQQPLITPDFAGAWGSVLAFDTLVFILTVVKALQIGIFLRGSLCRIILRDGAIYFGFIVLTHIVNVLTLLVSRKPESKGLCVTLTNVISSTLMTRSMLNLRDPRRGRSPMGYTGSLPIHTATEDAES